MNYKQLKKLEEVDSIDDFSFIDESNQLETIKLLRKNPHYIKVLEHKEHYFEWAVKYSGHIIMHFDNLTDEQIMLALHTTPTAIEHIKNPTEKQYNKAIKRSPYTIKNLTHPTKQQQFLAVNTNPKAVAHINNIHPEVRKWIVERRPYCIKLLKDTNFEEKKKAIDCSYRALKEFDKTLEICAYALSVYGANKNLIKIIPKDILENKAIQKSIAKYILLKGHEQ